MLGRQSIMNVRDKGNKEIYNYIKINTLFVETKRYTTTDMNKTPPGIQVPSIS